MGKHIEMIHEFFVDDNNPPNYEFLGNRGELIRCKDCKHCRVEQDPYPAVIGLDVYRKHLRCWYNGRQHMVSKNHYCGYAEKQDE